MTTTNINTLLNNDLNTLKEELLKFEPITTIIGLFYRKYVLEIHKVAEYNPEENPTSAPLELVQALILKRQYQDCAQEQATKTDIENIYNLANRCCGRFGWEVPSETASADNVFTQGIRNYTAFVRGDSYPFQQYTFWCDILSSLSTIKEFGFELNSVVDVLRTNISNIFLKKDREICLKCLKEPITLQDYIKASLLTPKDLLHLFPTGTSENQIEHLLNKMSIECGELANIPDEHLFMSNPVQAKPIISLGDGRYFAGHLSRMFINSRKIFENLLGDNTELQRQYREKIRPKYLEAKLTKLLQQAFPNAIHLQNSTFTYNGKERENDYTVIVGNKAIVFEAKASRFKDSAYRGSELSYSELYEKNIAYASEQANIFEAYLKSQQNEIKLETKQGPVVIAPTKITEYIKFNVILDNLPANPLDRRTILEYATAHGLETNINPTFTIFDLEIVLDILDNEFLLIDYLKKKYDLNFDDSSPQTMCDEIDLLGLYLSTGLNIRFDPKFNSVMLTGLSADANIDTYYELRDKCKVAKPHPSINPKVMGIINKLNVEYIDIGLEILKMPFSDCTEFNHNKFIHLIEDGIKMAHKNKQIYVVKIKSFFLAFHCNHSNSDIKRAIDKHFKYNNEYIIEFNTKQIHWPFSNILCF